MPEDSRGQAGERFTVRAASGVPDDPTRDDDNWEQQGLIEVSSSPPGRLGQYRDHIYDPASGRVLFSRMSCFGGDCGVVEWWDEDHSLVTLGLPPWHLQAGIWVVCGGPSRSAAYGVRAGFMGRVGMWTTVDAAGETRRDFLPLPGHPSPSGG